MVLLICVQLVGNEPRAFVRGEQLPPVTVWQSAVQQQQMYVEYLLFVCSTLTCSGYRAIEFVYMEYVCVCVYIGKDCRTDNALCRPFGFLCQNIRSSLMSGNKFLRCFLQLLLLLFNLDSFNAIASSAFHSYMYTKHVS